jgi:hypothetical protein
MKRFAAKLDHVLGRIYTRLIAGFSALVAVVMLVTAILAWKRFGMLPGVLWFSGAMIFGALARAAWRSKSGLGDIDIT